MWRFLILLCTAFLAESQTIDFVELLFGNRLSIKMGSSFLDSVEFTSEDESRKYTVQSNFFNANKGKFYGSGSTKKFIVKSVDFNDQGTYIRRNLWRKITHITKVKVLPKRTSWACVIGDTCSISLNGIKKTEASLRFSSENVNLVLVERGSPVENLPDYSGRIKMTSTSIDLAKVNVSDVGNYTLFDGQDRKAVTIRLYVMDHPGGIDASPLFSLLLLGIPVGVCCCCKKRMCKKRSQSTTTHTVQYQNGVSPPEPPPPYKGQVASTDPDPMCTPGYPVPGESQDHFPPPPDQVHPVLPQYGGEPAVPQNPMYIPGYPTPGESQVHPPPDSAYPPLPQYGGQPAMPPNPMYAPGYPTLGEIQVHPPPPDPAYPSLPQYGGQPAMPPSPGFVPGIYNPNAGTEGYKVDIKMNEMSPDTPLLTPSQNEIGPPPAPYTGTDVLNSTNSTVQFNIDTEKSPTYNFL